ncbi:MAG TPA: hypothetical protein DCE71_03420 [Parachlamydiales bacterium]|nr:hypothetical protein [Parachlamydiales bacterium]
MSQPIISIFRPDPMMPDYAIIEDARNLIKKIYHRALSILRELSSLLVSFYRLYFYEDYQYDRPLEWNPESKGLCVMVHGLSANPTTWNLQFDQLRNHPDIDTFAPVVTKAGFCSLEEAADPILPVILDYAEKNPKKPICLIGTSNGSRICTYLETLMRDKAPSTPVKVSTIAGIHFGSSLMNHLNWLGLAKFFMPPVLREELPYGNKKAQELLARVREPLGQEAAERAYEFFATPDDLIVPDLESSLPALNKGEVYHILPGHSHCSLPGAIAKKQIALCVEWIFGRLRNGQNDYYTETT